MKKRTSMILAALLIFSMLMFTGCGNDEPLNDNNPGSTASDDIERGLDDIGDGIEKGVDDLGDDLTDKNKTDGSGVDKNAHKDEIGKVDESKERTN